MDDRKLVSSYMKYKNSKDTAAEFGVPVWKVRNRIAKLRQYGVQIPNYGFRKLTEADVAQLNSLVASLDTPLDGLDVAGGNYDTNTG